MSLFWAKLPVFLLGSALVILCGWQTALAVMAFLGFAMWFSVGVAYWLGSIDA